LIGRLYHAKRLFFPQSTTGQYVVPLDGSAVAVQAPVGGLTALTVNHNFDYTDVGDGSVTVTGSGLGGDIIALGAGNNKIVEAVGDNFIFVKDEASAGNENIILGSGNNTVYLGHGADTVTAGGGVDTIVYSGLRSQYQVTLLSNGDLQIADQRTGAPDGID